MISDNGRIQPGTDKAAHRADAHRNRPRHPADLQKFPKAPNNRQNPLSLPETEL
jgi:hypothetical protein